MKKLPAFLIEYIKTPSQVNIKIENQKLKRKDLKNPKRMVLFILVV